MTTPCVVAMNTVTAGLFVKPVVSKGNKHVNLN